MLDPEIDSRCVSRIAAADQSGEHRSYERDQAMSAPHRIPFWVVAISYDGSGSATLSSGSCPGDHYFGPLFSELRHAGVHQEEPKVRRSKIRRRNMCHPDMCHPDTYHPYMRHQDLRHPDMRHPQLAHIASRAYLERIDHLEWLGHLEIHHPGIGHSHLSERWLAQLAAYPTRPCAHPPYSSASPVHKKIGRIQSDGRWPRERKRRPRQATNSVASLSSLRWCPFEDTTIKVAHRREPCPITTFKVVKRPRAIVVR
jgi:hypothetical protein